MVFRVFRWTQFSGVVSPSDTKMLYPEQDGEIMQSPPRRRLGTQSSWKAHGGAQERTAGKVRARWSLSEFARVREGCKQGCGDPQPSISLLHSPNVRKTPSHSHLPSPRAWRRRTATSGRAPLLISLPAPRRSAPTPRLPRPHLCFVVKWRSGGLMFERRHAHCEKNS